MLKKAINKINGVGFVFGFLLTLTLCLGIIKSKADTLTVIKKDTNLYIQPYTNSFTTVCPDLFYRIPIIDDQTKANTIQLCNSNYAVLYSTITRTPLYSYEHEENNTASVKRNSEFKEDVRLSPNYRSTLRDYKYSGYDKGHLTPSGDMHSIDSQHSTFLLSNIAPQSSKLNQQAWRILEQQVEQYPYKVTGVLFNAQKSTILNKRVIVPSQFYKIVSNGTCTNAYIADNTDSATVKQIDVVELNKLINNDFQFPYIKCEK